jgi:predicted nucleotidyltransferase component of viral defense system
MVILPINKKLKKRIHKLIALAQDILVIELYDKFPSTIIHGGTAIWRCYGSNRFSEDVDVYLPLTLKKENFEKFLDELKSKGFFVEKFKRTNNSIFAKFSYLNVIVSFEAVFKNIKNFLVRSFEMSDGSSILVNTLAPEDIIKEKVSVYLARRRVRDLYDIFFLLRFVEKRENVKEALTKLISNFEKPLDEKELKVLIISGSVPTVENMIKEVRKWVR